MEEEQREGLSVFIMQSRGLYQHAYRKENGRKEGGDGGI